LQLGNQLRRDATANNILNRRLPFRTALNAAASPRSHRSSIKSHTTRCEAVESFNASRSEAGSNPRLSVFGSPRPSILQNTTAHTPLHVARARRGFLSELQSIKDEENVAGPIAFESPLDIVLYPDPRLRAPNKRVNVFDESLQKLVAEMFDGTLYFDRMTPEVLDTIRSKLIELEDKYAEATGAPPPESVAKRPVADKAAEAVSS
ncbi:unnamed protein product, partial [Closterium sp. NIES-54]